MEQPPAPLVADSHGVICAFGLSPLATLDPDDLGDIAARQGLWLHFNLVDHRAEQWLNEQTWLPEAARETLLEDEPHVHVQLLPEGFVAVLRDLRHGSEGDEAGFGTLVVYVDERRIVSGRRLPLRSLDRLRREVGRGQDVWSSVTLFEQLVECLTDTVEALVAKLERVVEQAEDAILAGHFYDRGTELRQVRWLLSRLRREGRANRTALARLPQRLPESWSALHRQSVAQTVERFASLAQDLEFVEDRARLMQEEIAGRLGEATNRNLYLLSIMTTTLLPITLITGVFGMNVGGLPWLRSGNGFWYVVVLMALSVLLTLAFISRRSRQP
jgi:zinc transporter